MRKMLRPSGYGMIVWGTVLAVSLAALMTASVRGATKAEQEKAVDKASSKITHGLGTIQEYELSALEKKWLSQSRAQLTYRAATREEHEAWEKRARAKLRELYGITPELAEPPEIIWKEDEETEEDGIRVRYFQHRAYDGELRDHILLEPKEPKGVVIVLNDQTTMEAMTGLDSGDQPKQFGRGVGMPMAKAGLAVVVTELRGFGRDEHPPKWGYHGIYVTSSTYIALGKDLLAVAYAKDNFQTVAVARQLYPKLKIGFVGISKSGRNTAAVAALSEDVAAAYPAAGVEFEHRMGFSTSPHRYPPGFLEHFVLPDMLCLIAPRPLRLNYGLNDGWPYNYEARERETLKHAQRAYNNLGALDKVSQHVHGDGHDFDIQDVKAFFVRELSQ